MLTWEQTDRVIMSYTYGIFERYVFTLYLRYLLFVKNKKKTFIYTQNIPKI